MKHDLAIAAVLVALMVAGIGCSSKSNSDADWEEVQKTATRVESGLRHETLIALRSKVADLDAVVTNYTRHHSDGQKEQRVRSITQAVDALEWGIDHDKDEPIWERSEGFSFFAARPYLSVEPKCDDSSGKLYVSGRELGLASLAYAQSALVNPEKADDLHSRDYSALRNSCTTASQAKRERHVQNWPLQVDITSRNQFSFVYQIDGQPEEPRRTSTLMRGEKTHFDAKHEVRIFGLSLNDDYKNALISVNGKKWKPEWSNRSTSIGGFDDMFDLETTIELQ